MPSFNYTQAKQAGYSDDEIADYLDQQKAAGVDMWIDKNEYQPTSQSATQEPAQKEPGLVKKFAQGILKAPAEVYTSYQNLQSAGPLALRAVGAKLTGNEESAQRNIGAAKQELSKSRDLPFMGETKPAFTGQETTGQAAQKMAGYGAELATWYGGGAGAKQVVQQGLKGAMKEGAKTGAKYGVFGGALTGAGQSLQEGEGGWKTLGEAAMGAGIGLVGGAAIGAAIPAAVKGATQITKPITQKIAEATPIISNKVDSFVGKVIQGKTDDIAKARKALQTIDVSNVKTYDDLNNTIGGEVSSLAKKQDELFSALPQTYKPKNLTQVTQVGKTKVSQNYVTEALKNLSELYGKTAEPAELAKIVELANKLKTEGLNVQEINNLARQYGSEFGNKAFSKTTGDALTSVNAVKFENIRKGVKNTARKLMPDKASQELDAQLTNLYSLQKNIDEMVEKVNTLNQKIDRRNIIQKGAHKLGEYLDILTLGIPKNVFNKFLVSSNVGEKVMNSVDLEEALVKNLKKITSLEKKLNKPIPNTATQRTLEGIKSEARTIPGKVSAFIKKPKIGLGIEDVSGGKPSVKRTPKERSFKPGETPSTNLAAEAKATQSPTRSLSEADLVKTEPVINLKRDVPVTDIHGNKRTIPSGEALTPYELKGNKVLLKDGEEYVVSKNQYQNIKGNAVKAEAKEFAPELKGTEETVNSSKKDIEYKEVFKKIKKAQAENNWTEAERLQAEWDKTGTTKYSKYQLPDGKNYKEVLIKAPSNPEFKSSHWDEPNVISHLRLNERTYKGKKVTFMEELQSDWAREGRSKGFAKSQSEQITELKQQAQKLGMDRSQVDADIKLLLEEPLDTPQRPTIQAWKRLGEVEKKSGINLNQIFHDKGIGGVPNNPLLKNWQELSVKRALKEAVDNNAEYLAWTTGEQQAARYNLSQELNSIEWGKPSDFAKDQYNNTKKVLYLKPKTSNVIEVYIDKNGKILNDAGKGWEGKQLNEAIGKGVAEKILAEPKGNLSGEGLNIGGEWAKNLYDKQVKNIVEDLTGGKVEVLDMGLPIRKDEVSWAKVNSEGHMLTGKLKPEELKVGMTIEKKEVGQRNPYIVADILGDGKFKAVPKKSWDSYKDKAKTSYFSEKLSKKEFLEKMSETFDISTKKSSGQQAIKITPEIRAKVLGEAPKLKQPSGVSPFRTLEPQAKERSL